MASITIRQLDGDLKKRLRLLAASHGRSMEDEVRTILRAAAVETPHRPAAHREEPDHAAAARADIRSVLLIIGGGGGDDPTPHALSPPDARPLGGRRISSPAAGRLASTAHCR